MDRAVVITANPLEFKAVCAHLDDLREVLQPMGNQCIQGTFYAMRRSWDVLAINISLEKPAGIQDAKGVIKSFSPQAMLFVDLASGIKNVKQGDVVAANKVYHYATLDAGISDDGRMPARQPYDEFYSTYSMELLAGLVARRKTWLKRLGEVAPDFEPKVSVGPIVSGKDVAGSKRSNLYKFLRSNFEDAIALDIDGVSPIEAALGSPEAEVLVIRGIADLISDEIQTEAPKWRELAARTSSAFAFEVLANHDQRDLSKYETLGKLSSVPELPMHLQSRTMDFNAVKASLLYDAKRMIAITSASRGSSLLGVSGIGKSTLASAVVRDEEVRHAFTDGIFWMTLGPEPNITLLQSQLASGLGAGLCLFESSQEGKSKLKTLLSARASLLVLDDVWKVRHLEAFEVLGHNCKILITTRNSDLVTALGAKKHILSELKNDEALSLMAGWSGQDLETLPDEARMVAKECGNMPLTLAMIGAAFRSPDHWAKVLSDIRNVNIRNIRIKFLDWTNPEIYRAIQVSIEALDPEDRARYHDFAVFPDNTSIPEAVLGTFWRPEGLDEQRTKDTISRLVDRSLLQRSSDGHLSLHKLMKEYLCKEAEDLSALHNRLLNAYSLESQLGWDRGPNDGYFFQHLPHHMIEAGRSDELRNLLLDFNWLEAKLNATDVISLIYDYDLLSDEADLSVVQKVMEQSVNVLAYDKTHLEKQLLSALTAEKSDRIQSMLSQIGDRKLDLKLRLINSSLKPSGGPTLHTLEGHTGWVNSVAVTPNGRRVVSASDDSTLKIWDLESGELLGTLAGHSGRVNSVAITPDGRHAVSASDDGTIKIWDLTSGALIKTLTGHSDWVNSVAVTPDGRRVVSASDDSTIKVWDLEKGELIRTLEGHAGRVNAVAVNSDGKHAISASSDGTLKVWKIEQGAIQRDIAAHSGSVNAVALTPDGHSVLSASDDRTIVVWDLDSGKALRRLKGHSGPVRAVAITPDGEHVISGSFSGRLWIWELGTGDLLSKLEGHSGPVRAVVVTQDNRRAITASYDRTLKIWDLGIGDVLHADWINAVEVTPDGQYALSASFGGSLKVWKIESDEHPRTLEGHTAGIRSVAIFSGGKQAITASYDKTLKIWDLVSGEVLRTLVGHSAPVRVVAVSPNGRHAVSGSFDTTLKVWDIDSGNLERSLEGHNGWINAVLFTHDGRYVLSGSSDNTLRLWDLERGVCVKNMKGHTGPVRALALIQGGQLAISASSDNTLRIWNLLTGEVQKTLKGHADWINDVAVIPDGNHAISASYDRTLKIWDLKSGAHIRTLVGHRDWVNSVKITPNGRWIISVSDDSMVKVWNPDNGEEIACFSGTGPIRSCATSPDGVTIVAGEESGKVHILRIEYT